MEYGGHAPDEAHRLAVAAMGGERLEWWQSRIATSQPNSIEGQRFKRAATAFLESPMAAMAAFYDWNDVEVFGVFEGPPRAAIRRPDAMGLVAGVAWSRIGARLIDLDGQQATIETGTGHQLIRPRFLTGRRYCVTLWESDFLTGGKKNEQS